MAASCFPMWIEIRHTETRKEIKEIKTVDDLPEDIQFKVLRTNQNQSKQNELNTQEHSGK